METSKNGLNLIKQFEGCHLTSYKCPAGVWTIGYGHTQGVTEGQSITQEQADLYLKTDLKKFEHYVKAYTSKYSYILNQNQFDALVSFTYNAGPGNLERRLLLKGARPIELVKFYLPTTCISAKGKTLPGLVRRRVAEADFMGDCHRDIKIVAQEVIDGKWGNGQTRKKQLTDVGYDYTLVQEEVNKICQKHI